MYFYQGTPGGQAYFSALMHASARTARTFPSVPMRTSLNLPLSASDYNKASAPEYE